MSGLAGSGLIVLTNGANAAAVSASGTYTFSTLPNGTQYTVTVGTQPSNPTQVCTVNNGTGTIAGANVTNVAVVCVTNSYTVGGTISALTGSGLVLQSGGTNIPVSAGTTVYATLPSGTAYAFTVQTQPTSPTQSCTIANASGTVGTANVTNVNVTCVTTSFNVGGTVSGLTGTGLVLRNGGTNIPITPSTTVYATLPSGTAYAFTVQTQPTNPAQTCTIANPNGTVTVANITSVNVTCVTNKYSVSVTINGLNGASVTLQDNGGDTLPETTNGTYPFATQLLPGATYAVTVLTQPTGPAQYCAVTGGTGTIASANIVATLTCRNEGRFAFVADTNGGTVSSFTIDDSSASTSGLLALVNSVAADATTGSLPAAIAVNPNFAALPYVYTANSGTGDVSAFLVAADGTLGTAVSTPTGVLGSSPQGIAVDPSGNFLLVTDAASGTGGTGNGVIVVFEIDQTLGTLTQVTNSPFAAALVSGTPVSGTNPTGVAVDPSDQFVYVTNDFNPTYGLSDYSFDSTDVLPNVNAGNLTPLTAPELVTGNGPVWVTVDPLDRFVYVSNNLDGTISGWTIGTGGALAAIPGSPFATGLAAGTQTGAMAIDPSGQFLYVADNFNNVSATFDTTLVAFTIDQSTGPTAGALTLMTGGHSTTTVDSGPFPVNIDSSGHFLYVGNTIGNTISMFTVDTGTGFLTPVPGSPLSFAPGLGPNAIVIE